MEQSLLNYPWRYQFRFPFWNEKRHLCWGSLLLQPGCLLLAWWKLWQASHLHSFSRHISCCHKLHAPGQLFDLCPCTWNCLTDSKCQWWWCAPSSDFSGTCINIWLLQLCSISAFSCLEFQVLEIAVNSWNF